MCKMYGERAITLIKQLNGNRDSLPPYNVRKFLVLFV